ncbi:FecCD family ABC transporter permease [Brevibacillus sp. B_LB10_24]|uniref:FecCD family ABC transporter permease n=1 Tax=Brevibacillus sp. B_LB10_24 TaxID=3380645 RepID=UPI0038BC9DE4
MRSSPQVSRLWAVLAAGGGLIALSVYLGLTNGSFDMSVFDVLRTLLPIQPTADHDWVIFQFRLPRIVLGGFVGVALGVAGAVIQGVTRNGLADPGILGINAGAGMAIVLFMLLFQGSQTRIGWLGAMAMPLFGLIGGIGATALVYLFARHQGRLDSQRLILVGIAISSGFGAITMYASLKMNPRDFEMAVVWLAGSIYSANWKFVAAMLPWLIILVPIIWLRAHILDLFQLAEATTISLGVAVEREKNVLLLCSIGIISASVAVSGSIGFVGLIAPHLAKRLVGVRHRDIVAVSGVAGAAMVVIGDLIGKTVFAPAELAVGIVVSMIGVPYFIYLLMRSR